MKEYDGKLKNEYISILKDNGFSKKDINKIESLLYEYKDTLTDFRDLVGDSLLPDKFYFYNNMKHFAYLFNSDVDKTVTKEYLNFNKFIYYIVKLIGPNFLLSKQVIENRNVLKGVDAKDNGITLPKEPVMWTPNHHFKDDVLCSMLKTQRPSCMVFASIPHFFNSFDGILAYCLGVILINRKSEKSRSTCLEKMKRVVELGSDLIVWPEGVWHKNPNDLILHLWPGIYRLSIEKGTKVVPMVHYVRDTTQREKKNQNLIHTVIDEPIDFNTMHGMGERACLEYYRDIMCTWYYLMMEKYGQSTRKEELKDFDNSVEAWEEHLNKLLSNAARYDKSIETTASYRMKNYVTPLEVYKNIASLDITKDNVVEVINARKLVKEYKINDFQSRF